MPEKPDPSATTTPQRPAGPLQVVKIVFFGLLMIGRKGTWEAGGEAARITPGQLVAGAVIGGVLLVVALVLLVRVVLRIATG